MGTTPDDSPSPHLITEQFAVSVSHDRSHAVLEVTGALDLAGAPVLDEAIARAERDGYAAMIVLDLAGVTFCDAAGLGLLVSWHYALRAAGGRLVLTHPSGPVQRLLTVNHVDQLNVRGVPGR
jgi:anti-sigma B factor antagonist